MFGCVFSVAYLKQHGVSKIHNCCNLQRTTSPNALKVDVIMPCKRWYDRSKGCKFCACFSTNFSINTFRAPCFVRYPTVHLVLLTPDSQTLAGIPFVLPATICTGVQHASQGSLGGDRPRFRQGRRNPRFFRRCPDLRL